MKLKNEELAFQLESQQRVVWECGQQYAPEAAVALATKESDAGVPTLFAYYEGLWYLVQTSGQGPYVIWKENAL